ncbi:MAG: hypothetical protein ACTTH8_06475 [Treponema sp.]
MNTIPITFNERKISHTIIGGTRFTGRTAEESFCVIVLNRGRKYYRTVFFEELTAAGFSSIISIELNNQIAGIESLSNKYPFIKFLFPRESLTIGEMINIGLAETSAPYVLVLWSDVHIPKGSFTSGLLEKIKEADLLCAAPVLSNIRGESLLNQIVPSLHGNSFSTEQLACIKDKTATIYPYDFIGVYNRSKCIQIGGFDYAMHNPYWQNLDYGFRAHLWGESVRIFTSFRVQYETESAAEDVSIDASYRRFYLKNLAQEMDDEGAYIPYRLFIPYMRKSGLNPFAAWKYFSAARRWTEANKYRFKTTARQLTAHWEPFI